MLLDLQSTLKRRIAEVAKDAFNVAVGEPVVETPRDLSHGDLASPIAFELAKRIKAETGEKRNPRELAMVLAERLLTGGVPGIERIEIAGAGYVNFVVDRAAVLASLGTAPAGATRRADDKVIVEHTSVNPNKAAHIGHMRNSVLGDSVVRILGATGHNVEIQNYIDNTGVQVTDIVVGFLHVEPHTLEEIEAIPDPFDFYCWDLYSRVGLWYRDGNIDAKENPEKLALRNEAQHAIESGHGPIAEMAEYIATRNLEALLRTMLRLGIVYDVLPRESEVMQSNFWADAFEMLKSAGAIHYVEEGRHAGTWVMKADVDAAADEEDQFAADKILVKSNGLVTYAGKDIAYHLWKLDRIDRDFDYKPFFSYPDGRVAWITVPRGRGEAGHPTFGHGDRYINVIDVGQSYVQDFVKRGVMAVADDPKVAESTHLDYEKVGLTVAACDELGLPLAEEERKKSFVGMSGRKGRGVKADDLLDILERSALEEVKKRERGYSDDEERAIAHMIAVGAVRYFLLKFTRNSVIAFDFKEALSFTGETGPYIQNATVRLNSIFAKLAEAGIPTERPLDGVPRERVSDMLWSAENSDFWPLVYLAAQFPETLERAAATLEPAVVAKYAFQLAQLSNEFYHQHPVRDEPDETRRALLVEVIGSVRATLVAALAALGIDAPRRM
jgi:arginyl-tRNA synthetase